MERSVYFFRITLLVGRIGDPHLVSGGGQPEEPNRGLAENTVNHLIFIIHPLWKHGTKHKLVQDRRIVTYIGRSIAVMNSMVSKGTLNFAKLPPV